jgi:hypothetical protein
MAEIGVSRGDVSKSILSCVPDLVYLMVDQWMEFPPDHSYRESTDSMARLTQADYDAARELAVRQTQEFADRRIIVQASSELAAGLVAERTLDLAFIDAEHSYAALSSDLAFWWPKIRSGGILSGHDFATYEEVGRAVQEWARSQRGLNVQHGRGDVWYVERPV